MDKVVKESEIRIKVGLNAEKIPVQILWAAPDNPGHEQFQPVKALLMALFDGEHQDTLKMDLWTKELQVVEMDRLMFQTLRSLADTYYKATQNKELASDMQRFVQYFGEKTEIIPKEQ